MRFIFLVLVMLCSLTKAIAVENFPLCSSNETDDFTITSTNWVFKMCYTTPTTFKIKINSISLVNSAGSAIPFYEPATPQYTDLTQGVEDLAMNVTPVDGTYSALMLHLDATWKMTASADYTPSGRSTKYCRTKENANTFSNTSLTGNGLGSFLNGNNEAAVETTMKLNAFNFQSSTAIGSDVICNVYTGCDGVYFSKLTFPINNNNINNIEFYMVNSTKTQERYPDNVTGSVLKVNFINPIVINQETDSSYKISFDLSKAIGFAHDHSQGGSIIDNNECNYMTVGPLPVTLSVD
jgi:hypothetical protein